MGDENLLEKYKDIWAKTEDLENIALNVLQSMIIDIEKLN